MIIRREEKRGERGQSLVELALILPLLLIILAGVLDLGRMYYAYVMVTDAAAEGAAYAIVNPPDNPTDPADTNAAKIRARALSASGGLVEEDGAVEIHCPTCPNTMSGDSITVTVTYDFSVMTPFINVLVPDGVIPVSATASESVLSGAVD